MSLKEYKHFLSSAKSTPNLTGKRTKMLKNSAIFVFALSIKSMSRKGIIVGGAVRLFVLLVLKIRRNL